MIPTTVRTVSVALCSMAGILLGCASGPRVGSRVPDAVALDAANSRIETSALAGEVVVYYFWATWCAPCHVSSPAVQSLHEEFANRPVKVIAVHYDDLGDPLSYAIKKGYTYTLIPDGYSLSRAFGVSKIPQIIVVDPHGIVIHTQVGFSAGDETEIARVIEAHLP